MRRISIMKCSGFKIWLQTASELAILTPKEEIVQHQKECRKCASRLLFVQQTIRHLDHQRYEKLSEEKSMAILTEILNNSVKPVENIRWLIVSRRIAAILVVALGLLAGLLATQWLLSGSSKENDPWNSEFTLLSENTEYSMFD